MEKNEIIWMDEISEFVNAWAVKSYRKGLLIGVGYGMLAATCLIVAFGPRIKGFIKSFNFGKNVVDETVAD
jgi:galactitol-specific phosphotransferase system IIC component